MRQRLTQPNQSDRLAQLFDAVIGTLGRQSEARPLVLILEDLHWADGSSRDLLRFLVRNIRDERLLILCTYRSDDLHRRHALMPLLGELERGDRVERLDLRPFGRDELSSSSPSSLARHRRRPSSNFLLERSDGLPFYVEELVAGAEQSGADAAAHAARHPRAPIGNAVAPGIGARPRGGGHRRALLACALGRDIRQDEDTLDGRASTTPSTDASSSRATAPMSLDMHSATRFSAKPRSRSSCPPSVSACTRGIADHPRGVDRVDQRTPETSVIADFALHAYEARDQPRALEGSVQARRGVRGDGGLPRGAQSCRTSASSCGLAWTTRLRASGWIITDLLILASQSRLSDDGSLSEHVLLAQEA